jgi:hypothetical protein
MLRRILLVLAVALVIAAMMVALAMPAFAAGGAADNCGPPGQLISDEAKDPSASTPEAFGGPPGQRVKDVCAPGQEKM